MVRSLAVVAVLLFVFSVSAHAQPFQATWMFIPDSGAALTTTCGGATPIPDGRVIKIYWDQDSDGVDDTDPRPTLCALPPSCTTGPLGTVNYIQFTMNGTARGYGAGYFRTTSNFSSTSAITPQRYYLRIFETGDTTQVLWTSGVHTLTSGSQQIKLSGSEWVCGAGGPQCIVRDEHE
jgi:hypothetical protein